MGIPFDVLQTANADLNRVQANAAHAFSLVPEAVGIDVTATSKDLRIAGEGGVVVLDTTPRAVTLFLPAPRSDRVVVLLNKSRYAAHVRTADAKQTFPDVDAGAIGVAICDGAKWYVSGSLGGESTTPGSSGGSTTPFPPVPPLDAPYWLSTATPGLPNGVSLGVLGTGVLEQTSDGTTASPVVRPLTNMAVLFGGSDSLIAQDTNYFIYSPATVGLGIGSVPAAEAILTARRNANTQAALFVSNTDGGTDATSAVVAQAATSDTYLTIPYVVNGVFGRGTVSAPWNPYYVPGATLHGGATRVGHVFEIGTDMATSPPWWWVNRVGLATQQLRMQLDWDGHLFLPSSLGAGGIVWADSATTPAGQLKLVTIGTGLSFSGGTLSATGGTGTVTGVTGTAPMVVTPATPNPNVSLTIDGSLGVSAGALQRAALTGDATAGAGSNALTLATVNSSPGTFAYATVTVNGKGLATAVAAGATPALAARTLSATAPLLIGGGHGPLDLSADRTFSHDTSGVGAGTYNWASIIVDAYGHVTAAAANAAPQPAITWPAAKDILVSTGTSSNPTGEAAFTYDTAVNLFRLDGYQGIGVDPGTIADGKVVLAVQGNASQDRIYLRPGGIQLTASGSYAYVDVDPASTSIVTGGGGITLPVLATMRLRSAPWTGGGSGGATIPEMATLYIDGAPGVPAASPTLSLAMHVASGYSRFDGTVQWGQGTTIVVSGSTEIGPVNDGNLHHVNGSGSPVITGFTSGSSHRPGEVIILVFDNACTVKHLGTGTVQIYLRSGADLSAVANDTLMLVNDGTYWNQI